MQALKNFRSYFFRGMAALLPTVITIYRLGILRSATDENGHVSEETLRAQIRVTILHELGHHFGLDEKELRVYG